MGVNSPWFPLIVRGNRIWLVIEPIASHLSRTRNW